ncbi:MAG: polysaccharide biosynthesis/export family protein [Akkermansia muciniphila]
MQTKLIRILLAVMLMLLPAMAQTSTEVRAMPGGDVIINVKNVPSEDAGTVNGKYTVNRGDGTIKLPYLSSGVKVTGKTARDIERVVRDMYVEQKIYSDPIVQVQIDSDEGSVVRRTVMVTGYVGAKKNLPFRENLTLLQALIECGDISDMGSRYIQVTRGTQTRTYDYFSARDRALKLRPDDEIYVPRRPIYEGRPGSIGP